MRTPEGRLLRTFNAGEARLNAYLEDHAFLLEALLDLYEATFEERWFVAAREIADTIVARFADPENGGFFSTSDDHEALVARRKDIEDAPIPSGGSAAAFGLLRLAALTGEAALRAARGRPAAAAARDRAAPPGRLRPHAAGDRLLPRPDARGRARRRAGRRRARSRAWCASELRPHLVLAGGPGDGASTAVPLMEGRAPVDGRAAAYVCERFACQRPVTGADELARCSRRGVRPSASRPRVA